MTGAFDEQFAGNGAFRPEGAPDPGVVAACQDRPAEAAVIGALLREPEILTDVLGKLYPADFSDALFVELYDAIATMASAGDLISPITLANRLHGNGDLTERGGGRYLADLKASDRAGQGMGYVDHVVELATRRRLQGALRNARLSAANLSKPLPEIIQALDQASTFALEGVANVRPAVSIATAWDTTMASIDAIAAGTSPKGVRIESVEEWNEITGGMHPGQVILLGGRPGMGKTAMATTVAWRAAAAGHGVLFISREMPVEQLMLRIIADMIFAEGSGATFDDVQEGRLSRDDYRMAAQARAKIENWPLIFEEPEELNASRIAPLIRKTQRSMLARGRVLGLVIIDYLGLVDPPQKRPSKEQEVSDVSRAVKQAARSCRVPILALAQLNRSVESREDKRPMLSDLRDSGSLEQDADTVVFVYRAEYYLRQSEPQRTDEAKHEAWEVEWQAERDHVEIYSAKRRMGEPSRRRLYFFGKHQAVRSAGYYGPGGAA